MKTNCFKNTLCGLHTNYEFLHCAQTFAKLVVEIILPARIHSSEVRSRLAPETEFKTNSVASAAIMCFISGFLAAKPQPTSELWRTPKPCSAIMYFLCGIIQLSFVMMCHVQDELLSLYFLFVLVQHIKN
jgi:hypothetical protein